MGHENDDEPKITIVDPRTPGQKDVESELAPFLKKLLKEGRAAFTGERVAGLTDEERSNIGRLDRIFAAAGPGLERLFSGEVNEEFFEKSIKDPLLKTLREDLIPIAEEGLVSRGTFQGSPLLRTRRKLIGDAFDTLASERGKLSQSAREAPGKFLGATTIAAQAAQDVFSGERQVQQARFDAAFQEFIRTEPGSAEALTAALQFLGIGQLGIVVGAPKPEKEGIGGDLIKAGGQIAAAAAAAKIAAACVPAGTPIDIFEGVTVLIENVDAGMEILDQKGDRHKVMMKYEFAQPPSSNRFIHLVLEGGRELIACDRHIVDGKPMIDIRIGEMIAGSKVVSNKFVLIDVNVYDLLTASPMGGYSSQGIPIDTMIPELHADIEDKIDALAIE